ncbi:hypothetical protein KPL70_026807 [Citrus sinensis]|uniref:receptor-like protein EIX1 n=1 Tax=Citrus sinensis TaxID=2711 RepID=UPI0007636760|nr:receptor-like protein EIX1 [Citrus sinensis]XP_024033634.1 receptor-like protein EIX1 [Citrus x clementina]KAH9651593.1 hypothetical protein KPL70_026807 [Citrus sinensis]
MSVVVAFLFLKLFAIATLNISVCNGSSYVGCVESEREALLSFKQDLEDPSNRLATWIGDGDCCKWAGVICDNFTGHVLELHLGNPWEDDHGHQAKESSALVGKINPALLDFEHLIYLNLSYNDFKGIQIPRFLGSMGNLRFLDLSGAGFVGMIPNQIGNLSNLQYLNLRPNYLGGLYVEDLGWLYDLSLLENLDLSGVDLSKVSNGPLVTNALRSLLVLQLAGCQLSHFPPLSVANFSSLVTLDLSHNQFDNSLIATQLYGLCNLVFLDLSDNNFQGPIPDTIQNWTSLRHLDLSSNHFSYLIPEWLNKFSRLEYLSLSSNRLQGRISSVLLENLSSIQSLDLSFNELEWKIPRSFSRFCNLRSISLSGIQLSHQKVSQVLAIFSGCVSDVLESLDLSNTTLSGSLTNQIGKFKVLNSVDLSENSISGQVPWSLGKLSSLRYLDISNNQLNGTVSEIHFANLSSLTFFYASRNSLTLKANPNWVPVFQLEELDLRSCYLGPPFPSWLHSQNHLVNLDISDSGIVDTIPNRFWKSITQFNYLSLSNNQIHGEIPNLTEVSQLGTLDLSANNLSGQLPLLASNVMVLDLSKNKLSGSILHFVCHETNGTRLTQIINLEDNLLAGEIPDCWMNWRYLLVLRLDNNKFTGKLPTSLGALSLLRSLHLRNNNLSGTLPVSLGNCTELETIDISENEFSGNVPAWIGERFPRMIILILRSNKFHGVFPLELCHLAFLKILVLAGNNLSGTIPTCISNFTAMATFLGSDSIYTIQYPSDFSFPGKFFNITEQFVEEELITLEGKTLTFKAVLRLLTNIDLSNNKFSGEIPAEITVLRELQSLNLSHNFFSGRIPENIGAMALLESLDFSSNRLEGEIPKNTVNLVFLSHFNISYNNLSGEVPDEAQFATFDSSSYIGDEYLCGPVLKKLCTVVDENGGGKDGYGVGDVLGWLYVSFSMGFIWWLFGL